MRSTGLAPLVLRARDTAQVLLADLPQRWRHSIAVARTAGELAGTLGEDDPDVLVAAAWLHDIGYADPLVDTGFHPLDGARYLDHNQWPPRICALVAHHSGARFVADERGLSGELNVFPGEETALSDALTYADQSTGPAGHRLSITDRIAEARHRHGPPSAQAAARNLREPYLLAVAARVEKRRTTSARP